MERPAFYFTGDPARDDQRRIREIAYCLWSGKPRPKARGTHIFRAVTMLIELGLRMPDTDLAKEDRNVNGADLKDSAYSTEDSAAI